MAVQNSKRRYLPDPPEKDAHFFDCGCEHPHEACERPPRLASFRALFSAAFDQDKADQLLADGKGPPPPACEADLKAKP